MKVKTVKNIRLMAEGDPSFSQSDMEAAVAAAVADATGGLTTKNTQLLEEIKATKDSLSGWDGLDLDDVKKTMNLFNQSEEAQLLKDGKFDEVVAARTEKLRAEYDGKIADLKNSSDLAIESGQKFEKLYKNKVVDDEIRKAALSAKVIPEALEDVLRRGRDIFSLGDDGKVEARGSDGELVKVDEHLMTPGKFMDQLKKATPYYWPMSEGTGAGGSGKGGPGSDEKLASLASSGDSNAYREMRRKQRENK